MYSEIAIDKSDISKVLLQNNIIIWSLRLKSCEFLCPILRYGQQQQQQHAAFCGTIREVFTVDTEAHSYDILPLLDIMASVCERLRGSNSGHVGGTTWATLHGRISVSTCGIPGPPGWRWVCRLQWTGRAAVHWLVPSATLDTGGYLPLQHTTGTHWRWDDSFDHPWEE